jgi:hypothetical protein
MLPSGPDNLLAGGFFAQKEAVLQVLFRCEDGAWPAVSDVPWELTIGGHVPRHKPLGMDPGLVIFRSADASFGPRKLESLDGPLRIGVILSNTGERFDKEANDFRTNLDREFGHIRCAIKLEWFGELEFPPSLASLYGPLCEFQPQILIYLGHGKRVDGRPCLSFAVDETVKDKTGSAKAVPAEKVAEKVMDWCRELAVVVLLSCNTALTGAVSGTATTPADVAAAAFLKWGAALVVGMQGLVRAEFAAKFAGHLLENLFLTKSLAQAFNRARQQEFYGSWQRSREWALPVLYVPKATPPQLGLHLSRDASRVACHALADKFPREPTHYVQRGVEPEIEAFLRTGKGVAQLIALPGAGATTLIAHVARAMLVQTEARPLIYVRAESVQQLIDNFNEETRRSPLTLLLRPISDGACSGRDEQSLAFARRILETIGACLILDHASRFHAGELQHLFRELGSLQSGAFLFVRHGASQAAPPSSPIFSVPIFTRDECIGLANAYGLGAHLGSSWYEESGGHSTLVATLLGLAGSAREGINAKKAEAVDRARDLLRSLARMPEFGSAVELARRVAALRDCGVPVDRLVDLQQALASYSDEAERLGLLIRVDHNGATWLVVPQLYRKAIAADNDSYDRSDEGRGNAHGDGPGGSGATGDDDGPHPYPPGDAGRAVVDLFDSSGELKAWQQQPWLPRQTVGGTALLCEAVSLLLCGGEFVEADELASKLYSIHRSLGRFAVNVHLMQEVLRYTPRPQQSMRSLLHCVEAALDVADVKTCDQVRAFLTDKNLPRSPLEAAHEKVLEARHLLAGGTPQPLRAADAFRAAANIIRAMPAEQTAARQPQYVLGEALARLAACERDFNLAFADAKARFLQAADAYHRAGAHVDAAAARARAAGIDVERLLATGPSLDASQTDGGANPAALTEARTALERLGATDDRELAATLFYQFALAVASTDHRNALTTDPKQIAELQGDDRTKAHLLLFIDGRERSVETLQAAIDATRGHDSEPWALRVRRVAEERLGQRLGGEVARMHSLERAANAAVSPVLRVTDRQSLDFREAARIAALAAKAGAFSLMADREEFHRITNAILAGGDFHHREAAIALLDLVSRGTVQLPDLHGEDECLVGFLLSLPHPVTERVLLEEVFARAMAHAKEDPWAAVAVVQVATRLADASQDEGEKRCYWAQAVAMATSPVLRPGDPTSPYRKLAAKLAVRAWTAPRLIDDDQFFAAARAILPERTDITLTNELFQCLLDLLDEDDGPNSLFAKLPPLRPLGGGETKPVSLLADDEKAKAYARQHEPAGVGVPAGSSLHQRI